MGGKIVNLLLYYFRNLFYVLFYHKVAQPFIDIVFSRWLLLLIVFTNNIYMLALETVQNQLIHLRIQHNFILV
jgi:hypothetical protein